MASPELLSLLPSLEALLEEGNVTRAAARLNISQPRMSARLAQLRALLADPLLAPALKGRGMALTPRAQALRSALPEALRGLGTALAAPEPFDAARSRRTFRLLANDNALAIAGPALVGAAHDAGATGVRFAFLRLEPSTFAQQLERGEADLALGSASVLDRAPALLSRVLLRDRFATAQRRTHPRGTAPLDLDAFCRCGHVMVSSEGAGFVGSVDQALAALGRERHVVASAQGYLLALAIAASSDLLATLPERLLHAYGDTLMVFETPLPLEPFQFGLAWHPRMQADSAHAWLRTILTQTLRNR
jgi:DNA-binding transcriptional LysR family regulator